MSRLYWILFVACVYAEEENARVGSHLTGLVLTTSNPLIQPTTPVSWVVPFSESILDFLNTSAFVSEFSSGGIDSSIELRRDHHTVYIDLQSCRANRDRLSISLHVGKQTLSTMCLTEDSNPCALHVPVLANEIQHAIEYQRFVVEITVARVELMRYNMSFPVRIEEYMHCDLPRVVVVEHAMVPGIWIAMRTLCDNKCTMESPGYMYLRNCDTPGCNDPPGVVVCENTETFRIDTWSSVLEPTRAIALWIDKEKYEGRTVDQDTIAGQQIHTIVRFERVVEYKGRNDVPSKPFHDDTVRIDVIISILN